MSLKSIKSVFALAALVIGQLLFASAAQAGPMTGLYQLSSHPGGNANPPPYGLRLDGLLDGNAGKTFTFDFDHALADMKMNYDGSSIHIFGQAWGGRDVGGTYSTTGDDAARLWTIDFTYLVGTFVDTGSGVQVQNAADGAGSLNNGTISSDLGTWDLVDYSGSHSYTFQLDTGHRGHPGLSGWGWVNHCESSTNPYGGTQDGRSCDTHLTASDWLFTAEKIPDVPEPSALILLALGLLGIGGLRKFA